MHPTLDILIVDDEQNMRLTLSEILSKEGYKVETASTGEEAVELCRHKIYRVVLMDVRMPGIDGLEAFRQIRQHCRRSQIILMSAYANADLENSAIQQGVLDFLPKPLDIEAVLTLITRVTSTAVLYAGSLSEHETRLRQALLQQGFLPTFVPGLDEALAQLEQINYDVLILDLDVVPPSNLSGFVEAARQVHSQLAIVYAVGVSAAGEQSSAHQLPPASATLNKPIKIEALVTLLEQVKRERLGVCPPDANPTS